MSIESSLTTPWDRVEGASQAQGISRPLTDTETVDAVSELHDVELLSKFPKSDRFYADPLYQNQVYCLHSFIPSKGATPDDKGVFGFMKCRGTFFNTQEADQRAEWIIRNADSYHPIQTSYAGRPFPICSDTERYVKETTEIDIRKKAVEVVSEDIKQTKMDERNEIKDIKEREQRLLDESKDDFEEDPLDKYTTLQVKKANLLFTYVETMKKMQGMKSSVIKCFGEIKEMNDESDHYHQEYRAKYDAARKAAHIPDGGDIDSEGNWMRFLGDDHLDDLDFDPRE